MAGEWIKMRTNLWDDPRISQLVDRTGSSEAAVIGGLYWLWAAADEHTEHGLMPGLSICAIDRKTGVKGLGDALVAIEWIHDTDGGITINRFEEHNGASAKTRVQTAKRVANHKANAQVTLTPLADQDETVSDALPREEKRREETTTTPNNPQGLFVASVAGEPVQAEIIPHEKPCVKPDCPHKEIVALYHEILPANPAIRDWTPARADTLRVRWNEKKERQDIAWWRRFFEYIAESAFLTGRVAGAGKAPFTPGLEWILKAENFAKIREGRYDNKAA